MVKYKQRLTDLAVFTISNVTLEQYYQLGFQRCSDIPAEVSRKMDHEWRNECVVKKYKDDTIWQPFKVHYTTKLVEAWTDHGGLATRSA